jgi:16S rRNA (cytosine1402-N4)-methyltransferase
MDETLSANDAGHYHVPVLLKEALDAIAIKPAGIYVDLTFGGGGHSRGILEQLGPEGRLIAFDQDEDARQNLPDDPRLTFVPHNFRHVERFLRLHKALPVDGVLADLGVSSHQFDEGERGFSIRFDAPLDMRMDRRQGLTAAQLVKDLPEEELHRIFERYGEVTNAKTLARTIVETRANQAMQTVKQFMDALQGVVKGNPNRYFAQVFQALRISVNDEFGALEEMLAQLPGILIPGGRVAIITFHSLEDRIVKHFFKEGAVGPVSRDEIFGTRPESPFRTVHKKPVLPTETEIRANPRSRSAKLRVAEKC